MRRSAALTAVLAAALACGVATPAAAGGLRVTDTQRLSQRQRDYTMTTPALKAPVHTRVLLPTGYPRRPKRRYPVLYLFHGGFGNVRDWIDAGDAERITARTGAIVVMPEDGNGGWYTDWFNGGRGGAPAWETFHVRQLLPWVDATFRTKADRGHRALAGLSTGGYGVMHDAARHPDLFSFAASFSGAVDLVGNPLVPAIVGAEAVADGGKADDVFGNRQKHAIGWRAGNPVDLAENLRGLRLQVRSGNGRPGPLDPPGQAPDPIEEQVHSMSLTFGRRLRALRIPHLLDDYGPGTHRWSYWRRDLRRTLPAMTASFARPPRAPRTVSFLSYDREYEIYGWHVRSRRSAYHAITRLTRAGRGGFRFAGRDPAVVRTPDSYRPRTRYTVRVGRRVCAARADHEGRLSVSVPGASKSHVTTVRIARAR